VSIVGSKGRKAATRFGVKRKTMTRDLLFNGKFVTIKFFYSLRTL
jgi:hypothetical protein